MEEYNGAELNFKRGFFDYGVEIPAGEIEFEVGATYQLTFEGNLEVDTDADFDFFQSVSNNVGEGASWEKVKSAEAKTITFQFNETEEPIATDDEILNTISLKLVSGSLESNGFTLSAGANSVEHLIFNFRQGEEDRSFEAAKQKIGEILGKGGFIRIALAPRLVKELTEEEIENEINLFKDDYNSIEEAENIGSIPLFRNKG